MAECHRKVSLFREGKGQDPDECQRIFKKKKTIFFETEEWEESIDRYS